MTVKSEEISARQVPFDPATMKSERNKSIAFLLITAVLWSSGGILIKLVDWNPMAISGVRAALAAVVLVVATGRPRFTWSFPQIGAAICYAATIILFVLATKLTTAANAILLQYTAPVYIALFGSIYLGERARLADWLAIAAVLAGMVLFFFDKLTTAGYWGNVCAIATAVTFAWFILFMRKQKAGSPIESVVLGNVLAAVICLPFIHGPYPGKSGWAVLAVLGVFQLGISYIFYARAIRNVTALEAILIPAIEPILNPLWVFLVAGESPSPLAIAGGVIVMLAVLARGVAASWR